MTYSYQIGGTVTCQQQEDFNAICTLESKLRQQDPSLSHEDAIRKAYRQLQGKFAGSVMLKGEGLKPQVTKALRPSHIERDNRR